MSLTIVVTDDKGLLIRELRQSDFNITVDKRLAEITSFTRSSGPISVGVLFDASGSAMTESKKVALQRKRAIFEGLAHFLDLTNPASEYFVIGFNAKAELWLDWTSDHRALFTALNTFVTKGQTALYDACWLGTQKLAQAHHARRLLILISDGNDNASKQTFNKTRDLLKEEGVPLYSIGILDSVEYGTSLGMEGQGILDELSSLSGALSLFPRLDSEKPTQVNEVFELIANEIASQYAITIKREPFSGNNKWHKVSVRIADQVDLAGIRKRLTARTRQVFGG